MQQPVICFFNTNKDWGGGEKWHHDVALRMHAEGYSVVAIADENSALYRRIKPTGIPLYQVQVSNWSFLNPRKITRLSGLFRQLGITTIVLNLSADVKTAGIAARRAGIQRIIYRRGSAIPVRNTFLNRYLFRRVITDILVNSEETRRTILQNNRRFIKESSIRLIYNGLKVDELEAQPGQPPYTRGSGELLLGNLGRMVEQKAQHYLIDLLARLRAEGYPAKLIIGGEGPLRGALEKKARQLQVHPYVMAPGFIYDVKGFMQSLDVFVLSSLWEGFGYVLAEAMYFSTPVVAFQLSSNPEIVQPGITGLLADFDKPDDLYQQVKQLLDSEATRKQMGQAGRQRVLKYFHFDKNMQELKTYLTLPQPSRQK